MSQSIFAKTLPATNFQVTHDFINKMVKEHHFSKTELVSIFSQVNLIVAEKKPKSTIKKPKAKTMSWDKYRSLFITDSRIENGVEFWK
ncbi:lytic murein transglycosylase, partial [Candidatus Thioglobus sp.]|nr:lytic murein transglycosylase [Candidatus Thioglobus sp.]